MRGEIFRLLRLITIIIATVDPQVVDTFAFRDTSSDQNNEVLIKISSCACERV